MDRRKFLGSAGSSILFGLSGCIDLPRDEPTNNSTEPVNPGVRVPDERVIEPPYDITYPGIEESSWNPDYLGEGMSSSSTIDFREAEGASLVSNKLSAREPDSAPNEFTTHIFGSQNEFDGIVDVSDEARPVNFFDNFMLVIETGYAPSEVSHIWKRLEPTRSEGLRLYGYYREPFQPSPESSTIVSILEIPRNEDRSIPDVTVSLTITQNHMVNFSANEEIISIDTLP